MRALALVLLTGCATVEFAPRKAVPLDRPAPAAHADSAAPALAETMPPAAIGTPPQAQVAKETKLKNGVRVLVLEQHAHPLVSIAVVLQRGSIEAPPGVFDLFVDSLSSGSDLIEPKALHSNLYDYAVVHNVGVFRESSVVSAQFIAPLSRSVVRMVVPVFATPSFDADELNLLLDQHKSRAARMRDEPGARARRELYRLIFPAGSPYGDDVADVERPLEGVTRDKIVALRSFIGADDVAVVAAGDITPETLMPLLEDALGSLKPGARARATISDAPPPSAAHVLLLDHPHDSQAQIALGFPGVKYDDPDFPALYFLSKILQDAMRASLRLAHGSTYTVSGELRMMRTRAPLVLSAAVDATHVEESIKDTLSAIKNLDTQLARPGELDRLKNWILGRYAAYETVDEAVNALTTIAAYDLPADHFAKLQAKIAALSAEDLVRIARQYLDPTRAQLVVLGDAVVLRGEIDALGLGTADVRKVTH